MSSAELHSRIKRQFKDAVTNRNNWCASTEAGLARLRHKKETEVINSYCAYKVTGIHKESGIEVSSKNFTGDAIPSVRPFELHHKVSNGNIMHHFQLNHLNYAHNIEDRKEFFYLVTYAFHQIWPPLTPKP